MPYAVARCHGVPTPPHGLGLPRLPRSPRHPGAGGDAERGTGAADVAQWAHVAWRRGDRGGYPLGFIPIKPGKTYIFIGKVLGNHLEMVLRGYKEQIGSGDIAITWLDGGW